MASSKSALGIFFRIPELGKVKKRLAQQIGNELALKVYQVMLYQTIKKVEKLNGIDIYGFYEGSIKLPAELPTTFTYIPQTGKGLGQKMSNAVVSLFEKGYDNVVLIGSDSPDLPSDYIKEAFHMLGSHELVIGPAKDGGYYLIGMSRPLKEIFKGIVWGGDNVLKDTLLKAKEVHIKHFLLPEWYDIDDLESLKRWLGDNDIFL